MAPFRALRIPALAVILVGFSLAVLAGFGVARISARITAPGARAVLTHSKSPPEWLTELVKRRPQNVAVVAMANKMARTIWALTAHERTYQKGYVSQRA